MIANHLLTGFIFGLCLSIVSWMVGIAGDALLQRTRFYEPLSHLNFVPGKALNDLLGIEPFKRLVTSSVFGYLNQSIRLNGTHHDLPALRHRMTMAEISHLVGFLFVAAAALYQSVNVSLAFGLAMMIPNALLNGYPSLLQQQNKRRIDRLLRRQARRNEARGT